MVPTHSSYDCTHSGPTILVEIWCGVAMKRSVDGVIYLSIRLAPAVSVDAS
jgi:hypothetical protein